MFIVIDIPCIKYMIKQMKKIDRREFYYKAGKAGSGLILLGLTRKGLSSERPPNIIFFTADDLGWKELGCYGNSFVHSPNIDRLAGQGVRFTNAFVTASSCAPCRASIMSGQTPHSVGVLGLTHIHKEFSLSPGETLYPRLLRDAGYATALQGKWHVADFTADWKPYGFDRRFGSYNLWIFSAKAACRFIERNKDRPFYLEMNFSDTHRKAAIHFDMVRKFRVDPDEIHVPEYWNLPDWPEIRKDMAGYYSHAANMDSKIGEVLDCLDECGLAGNTLVCFVSDNGPPFPGAKMFLYDRGIGTPLIMRWPERIEPGSVREELVSVIDIMPTFLEAAGLQIPGSCQGMSLLPLVRGGNTSWRDAVFSEMTWHVEYHPMRSIRTNEWKYIINLSDDPVGLDQCDFKYYLELAEDPDQPFLKPRPPEELYSLPDDPNEQKNLADDPELQAKKAELKARLMNWMKDTKDPYAGSF